MPSGDRTGPRGFGPRTGRGLGYCAGYDTPGYTKGPGMGRGGAWGRGGGWGRGRGGMWGRGYGYGRGWGWDYRSPAYIPYTQVVSPQVSTENQLSMLKQEKEYLEADLNSIKNAIDELSKKIIEMEKEE
ncbi:MAG: DUF5320 domain-containing protein [Candidatus Thorarchaeota archaeon]